MKNKEKNTKNSKTILLSVSEIEYLRTQLSVKMNENSILTPDESKRVSSILSKLDVAQFVY